MSYPPPQGYGPSYGGGHQYYDSRPSPYGRPEGAREDHYGYQYDRPEPHEQHHYDRGYHDSRPPPPEPQYHYDSRGGAPQQPARYPPPSGGDPYGYDYYRQQPQGSSYPPPSYAPPPSGYYGSGAPDAGYGHHPGSSSYPPPAPGYPPAGSEYGPPSGGYPPPSAPGYPPSSYPPPSYPHHHSDAGHAPNGGEHARPPDPYAQYQAHYSAHYAAYGPPPPGYGAPPSYGYGAPPPHPGYSQPPLGYGPQPYPPPGAPRRGSPRRDGRGGGLGNKRRGEKGGGRGEKGGKKGGDKRGDREEPRRPAILTAANAKTRLQQSLQTHPEWLALWFEGIDPPRRMATTPNVTMLMLAHPGTKNGNGEKLGFLLSASHIATKKKERENECAKEIVSTLELIPTEDLRAWCQMPEAGSAKKEVDPADLERLTSLVSRQWPNTTIEWAEPTQCVLVAALPWGPNERSHGTDPELAILEKFDAGFAEMWQEAKRVSGLVRKQWFVAVVWAKPDPKDNVRPFALGIGLATEHSLAKARAVYAAEMRVPVLAEAMLSKKAASTQ